MRKTWSLGRKETPGEAMKSSIPFYIIGVIVIVAIIALIGKQTAVGTNPAYVKDVVGSPEVQTAGQSAWRAAKLGDAINPGDAARTASGSEIDLNWSDKTHVRLAENSEVSLAKAQVKRTALSSDTKVNLVKGKLWARLHKLSADNRSFKIQMKQSTVRIFSGACSVEMLANGGYEVQNLNGSVQLLLGKKEISLNMREAARADDPKKAPTITPLTLDQTMALNAKREISGAFVTITTPKEGDRVSGDILLVSGYSDPGNVVQVNDMSVPVDDKGAWTIRLTPTKGQNLVVTSRDEEGRETKIIRKLAY
jgi:hypothetical protein